MIDLIHRITKVTGEMTDAKKLKISASGNLNGIVKGKLADAKVETVAAGIGAGGVATIQCYHYRTLVHKVK
jgi:hypothetical protein